MNRLDSRFPNLVYPAAPDLDRKTARRLLVLIPADAEYRPAARRILDLAIRSEAGVLFLSLCKDPAGELSVRRELITMTALFQDAGVCAEARVETGINWMELVESSYHNGDLIACFAEQRAGLLQRPLSQILRSDLGAPVYILSDLSAQNPTQSNWLSRMTAWTGFICIIIAALVLQIRIVAMPDNWVQTILLTGSLGAELWLIWVWNGISD